MKQGKKQSDLRLSPWSMIDVSFVFLLKTAADCKVSSKVSFSWLGYAKYFQQQPFKRRRSWADCLKSNIWKSTSSRQLSLYNRCLGATRWLKKLHSVLVSLGQVDVSSALSLKRQNRSFLYSEASNTAQKTWSANIPTWEGIRRGGKKQVLWLYERRGSTLTPLFCLFTSGSGQCVALRRWTSAAFGRYEPNTWSQYCSNSHGNRSDWAGMCVFSHVFIRNLIL